MTFQCCFGNSKGRCKLTAKDVWWLKYNKGSVTVVLCKRHAPKSEDEEDAV